MSTLKAYKEVVEFIAAGTSPSGVISFHPSEGVKDRVAELVAREKNSSLSPEEKLELEHYLQLEHLMRLAKAGARLHLANA